MRIGRALNARAFCSFSSLSSMQWNNEIVKINRVATVVCDVTILRIKLLFYSFFALLFIIHIFFLSVSSNSCTVMWIFPIKHVCALSVLLLRYCLCSAKYVGARSGLAVLIRSNRLHISQSFSLSYKKLRVFQQNFTKKKGKYNLCE